ncbi:MaoC/PaaZ C-terminal domain-containing protein [Frankia sp. QA3]|uniref:MaoC/PaaZ C-terminal domain-containing protein n=1 Tax=Frankia sp. QA3 TaxID=710111 RepID=UPI000269C02C|nr:MaoC/PaaZ C-terminal domain-containing protein [Frankia sp. QA3]EIV91564.1 acyl dehydratase [Frankia sp. QA3]
MTLDENVTADENVTTDERVTLDERTRGPVTRVQIARYAGAVGDFNPVHVDDEFARASGLPSVIAHGPLTVTLALDAVVEQLGPQALRSAKARLSAPVFPGDELTVVPTADGVEVRKADGTVAATVRLETGRPGTAAEAAGTR